MVVRYSTTPKAVLAELVTVLTPDRAARAIPLDMPIDNTLRYVRLDVARLWLENILEHSNNAQAADALYSLGLRTKDWPMAESGSRARCRMMPSDRCTIELARTLELQGKFGEVIGLLNTVASWRGRREDQLTAWQMLCAAYRSAGQTVVSLDCAHRLSATGLQETP
jgi:predicted Zn-dependent protease